MIFLSRLCIYPQYVYACVLRVYICIYIYIYLFIYLYTHTYMHLVSLYMYIFNTCHLYCCAFVCDFVFILICMPSRFDPCCGFDSPKPQCLLLPESPTRLPRHPVTGKVDRQRLQEPGSLWGRPVSRLTFGGIGFKPSLFVSGAWG